MVDVELCKLVENDVTALCHLRRPECNAVMNRRDIGAARPGQGVGSADQEGSITAVHEIRRSRVQSLELPHLRCESVANVVPAILGITSMFVAVGEIDDLRVRFTVNVAPGEAARHYAREGLALVVRFFGKVLDK